MATALEYGKTGLKIVTNTASRPSPRLQALYPIPPIPIDKAALIDLALEPVAETGRWGIRITSRGTSLPSGGTWTLLHAAYQGSAPATIQWDEIPINGAAINLLLDQPLSSATHRFKLRCEAQGKADLYPEASIQTPGPVAPLSVALANSIPDGSWAEMPVTIGATPGLVGRMLPAPNGGQSQARLVDVNFSISSAIASDPLVTGYQVILSLASDAASAQTDASLRLADDTLTNTGATSRLWEWVAPAGLAAVTLLAQVRTIYASGQRSAWVASASNGLPAATVTPVSPQYANIQGLPTTYTPPVATPSVLGGVKVGAGLTVAADGTLSLNGGGTASWAGLSGAPVDSAPLMTLLNGKAAMTHSHTIGDLPAYPTLASLGAVANTDSRLSDARVASDVYAWAKAASKPGYTAAEVGALASGAQAVDSAKLGGQLPSYYQTALGFTPVNKAGDSGIGNLSMAALTATKVTLPQPAASGTSEIWILNGNGGDVFSFGTTGTAYSGLSWLPALSQFLYIPSNGTLHIGGSTDGAATLWMHGAVKCGALTATGATLNDAGDLSWGGSWLAGKPVLSASLAGGFQFWPTGINSPGGPSLRLWADQTAAFVSSVSMGALTATTGTFSGLVISGGNQGFQNSAYYPNVRNPIWAFANASAWGFAYYQGSAHALGEGIGFHWGDTAAPKHFLKDNGEYYSNGNLVYHAGNIEQSASALMAVQAYALAPQWVVSLPTLPNSKYPKAIWNAATSRYDGGLVCIISTKAMYQNQGDVWVAVGSNFAIFGQVTIAELAAQSVGAGTLVSDLIMTSIIRSTGYTPGSASAAPVGFKLSGTAFTTYYRDGTNSPDCFMELGGNGNFGGHRVLTVIDRVFWQTNRVRNGSFYECLEAWLATGLQPPVWSMTSRADGMGSAAQIATGPMSDSEGWIHQSLSVPKPLPGQTVQIQLQTGFSSTLNNGSAAGGVGVALVNQATGAVVSNTAFDYTNSGQTLSWTARTIDITSAVANGGDFTLKIRLNAFQHTNYSQTVCLYVSEVKLIA